MELSDGFLGEVRGHEEVSIGDEEMGVRLLNVGLQGLLQVLRNL